MLDKVIIHQRNTIHIVESSQIVYCKSDNCYTDVHLLSGERYCMVKSLSKFSKEVSEMEFIRVNQSYLVNKKHIHSIDKKNRIIGVVNLHNIPFTISLRDLLNLISKTSQNIPVLVSSVLLLQASF